MKIKQIEFTAELTDTFGGEANYSWVKRRTFSMPENCTNRALMRRAKKEMELSGVRGKTIDYGGPLEFRPYGSCTVLFISDNS